MQVSVKRIVFASANGVDSVVAKMYLPSGEIKGIVQIAHGFAEHIGRYHDFMQHLASLGYLACGNDHIGHGESVSAPERIGFMAQERGFIFLLKDMNKLNIIVRAEAPGAPCFLLGHHMGAMAAVLYATKYASAIDGLLLSAMPGPGKSFATAARIAGMIHANKGGLYRSEWVQKVLFGAYPASVRKRRTDLDWLTCDSVAVDAYMDDPYCGYVPTVSGMLDYIALCSYSGDKRLAGSLPEAFPILLFSGAKDPAVDFGKGTLRFYKNLIRLGLGAATVKLYPKGRHEMLHELNRAEVYDDIVAWIETQLKGPTENGGTH